MADYYTLQRKRNITVGIFVVLGICALFWLVMVFQDLPIAVSKMTAYNIKVQFPQAPGVSKNTPVKYCGYQIGRVIEVMPPYPRTNPNTSETYNQILAILAIDKDFKTIPRSVEILVIKRGLGSSFIEFKDRLSVDAESEPLDPNRPETKYIHQGMPVVQGGLAMANEFLPEQIQKKAEELINSMTTLLDNANVIVGDKSNQQNIKALLANTERATAQATKVLEQIKKLSKTGEATLNKVKTKINTVATAIDEASSEFAATMRTVRTTVEKANSGDGTAARLLNDGRLYENLLDSSAELELALEQLRKLITESRDKGLPIKLK